MLSPGRYLTTMRIMFHRNSFYPFLFLIPLFVFYMNRNFQIDHSKQITDSNAELEFMESEVGSCFNLTKKFIVITTINYPTESVKKLASLEGWCVIVVGDAKTPIDWKWPNCVYLNLKAQAALGYKTHAFLPQNHYGRKNIGYLYAIEQGAEVIYETDDDNLLTGTEIPVVENGQSNLSLFSDTDSTSKIAEAHEVCDRVVNIYEHFGHPTIWPRGIPMECIGTKVKPPLGIPHDFTKNTTHNGIIEKEFRVGVDQGLANGDPDMDAIFRLTRIPTGEKIDIRFDTEAPIMGLTKGTFSPYNSQNTVYYREAFWGLLMPISTSSRVSDIWRSYITQKLMWDVGLQLVFRSATVVQYRNPHSYMSDFDQERALYIDSGRLVDFLSTWDSTSAGEDIFGRMVSLNSELVSLKFMGMEDGELLKAWVEDLTRIGYTPPKIVAPLPAATNTKQLAWILHFTYEPIAEVVKLLMEHYVKHFKVIVIVSPTGRPPGLEHVLTSPGVEIVWASSCRNTFDSHIGASMVRCYVRGLQILSSHSTFAEIDYIVASNDDVLLFDFNKIKDYAAGGRPVGSGHFRDAARNEHRPVMFSPPAPGFKAFERWAHGDRWPRCQELFALIPESYKTKFRERVGENAMAGAADAFFLPVDSVAEFIEIGTIVGECWLEIALPNIMAMLSNPPVYPESDDVFMYFWDRESPPWKDKDFHSYISNKPETAIIHPFKLSDPENKEILLKLSKLW